MIIVVTGAKSAGKSSLLLKAAEILQGRDFSVGGVVSRRIIKDGKSDGYELVNLSNGESQLLATPRDLDEDVVKQGKFLFRKKALTDGINAIMQGVDADVLIVDEIGIMEINGGGWSCTFPMLAQRSKPMILGVRESVVEQLKGMGLSPDEIITVGADNVCPNEETKKFAKLFMHLDLADKDREKR